MNQILARIFPKQMDNNYQGSLIAKQVFIFLTIVTIVRSLIHICTHDGGAQSIASIPLNTYEPAAAKTIILMFSFWGLSQLLMGFIYIIAIWRYQTMIPLLYILMFIEYSMRTVLGHITPIVTQHIAPGSIGDKIIAPLSIIMFLLSIRYRKKS